MATLHHPKLGQIRGVVNDGVTQYFGIKYASLKHRFGTPELYDGAGASEIVEATKLGAAAVGIPDGCKAEYGLIQQSLPVPAFPPQSTTECLNLTVTAPAGHRNQKLPVFVFVHGGALSMGSGTWPQYDNAALVRRSVELGKPVIGVNINYRTNIFGFLTSEELRTAGFKANNGLRDQKVAFQWIKKYIEGFNGDPEQVTAIGQSAGGACVTLQLQSPEPLFHRMVVMSGTCLLLRPLPLFVHEFFYQQFCEIQGLTDVAGDARLRALEKLNSHDMLLKMPPSIPSLPALDNDLLTSAPTFQSVEQWSTQSGHALPGLEWCKELLVGDCQFDGNIYQLALGHRQQGIAKQFEGSLKRNIPGKDLEVDAILNDYGISTSKNDQDAYLRVLQIGNDICFYLPEVAFARNWPGTTYVYHLNEPNPWDGPFKGHSTHILDVALLFKNYDKSLDSAVQAVGQAYGDSVIMFINGVAPWKASTRNDPVAQVLGGSGRVGELAKDEPREIGRRDIIFRYKDSIGFDKLHEAFIAFLGGK